MTSKFIIKNVNFSQNALPVNNRLRLTSNDVIPGLGYMGLNVTSNCRVQVRKSYALSEYDKVRIPAYTQFAATFYNENTQVGGISNWLKNETNKPKTFSVYDTSSFSYGDIVTHFRLGIGWIDGTWLDVFDIGKDVDISLLETEQTHRIMPNEIACGHIQPDGSIIENNLYRVATIGMYKLAQFKKISVSTNLKWCIVYFKQDGTPLGESPSAWTMGTGKPVDITSTISQVYPGTEYTRFKLGFGCADDSSNRVLGAFANQYKVQLIRS